MMVGMTPADRLSDDLNLIVETHRLSVRERHTLARIVTGAVPGNRDRPLFLLALRICASDQDDLLSLILPGSQSLRRTDTALLDFLLTVALDTTTEVEAFVVAFQAARQAPDHIKALTSMLSTALHSYRSRALPEGRHHNVFTAVRRYLTHSRPEDPSPRDGDAPRFWEAEGRRDLLTRYVTALQALEDYSEAERLAETWRSPESFEVVAQLVSEVESCDNQVSDFLERLMAGIDTLANAPIKLLLAQERERLAKLAEHADLIMRWPGDVQAALTMGPVQAAISQAIRASKPTVDFEVFMAQRPSWQAVIAQIEELAGSLNACLHLLYKSQQHPLETASIRSSPISVDQKKIIAMERRQGFTELSIEARAEALSALIEPILLLSSMLERYRRAWRRLGPDRCASLEQSHLVLFGRKFAALYRSPEGS